MQKTGLTLMKYCGHFLIKAEGGAKNYKRDHRLPLAWRSFTVASVQQKGYIYTYISYYIDTEKYHESVTVCLHEYCRLERNTRI